MAVDKKYPFAEHMVKYHPRSDTAQLLIRVKELETKQRLFEKLTVERKDDDNDAR